MIRATYPGSGHGRPTPLAPLAALAAFAVLSSALAGEPDPSDPSDPALAPAPPPGAVGFPSRAPDLDVRPGFVDPPPGYGEVAFWWWLGDPLRRDRLEWQIERLAGKGVMGLQVNYAHSDRGGRSWGLTYPSDPPLFSEEWWDLFGWTLRRAQRRGMAVSLSDYTLGFGQGWHVDELLRDRPDLCGSTLAHSVRDVDAGVDLAWPLPATTLSIAAHRLDGGRIVAGSRVDLADHVGAGELRWTPPDGPWRVVVVRYETAPWSIDPLHPDTGPEIVARFFQRFEDRMPGEAGRGLDFFFSDELEFGVRGLLWTERLPAEFRRRKGYDLLPELSALFVDVGPRTPKVRLDYRDVMVSLSEEGYFRPVFEWHQRRGMIYGCDHGGRGRNVVEFGDYFRTQRWNQGPGSDQPRLGKDLIKAKVASSIAHLYERPRVWIEGYYGSGWGTSSAQVADVTFANFAMGYDLLTLHGLYYSTHGGWWEWAPPCNHHHMPYWEHMGTLLRCAERLAYLLSQGHHRCDVAVVYPVAALEAGEPGGDPVATAFAAGSRLYEHGIDFDFIDFQSLERARVTDRALHVSGEVYRALVLPSMSAVRHSTIEKARDLARGGGVVVAIGDLPRASDRVGRDDPELDAALREVWGVSAAAARPRALPMVHRRPGGGLGVRMAGPEHIEQVIGGAFPRDFAVEAVPSGSSKAGIRFQHRRIGPRDVYFIHGAPEGAECSFRATGDVERWDPWTGRAERMGVIRQEDGQTRLVLSGGETWPHVIVFSPGEPMLAPAERAGPEEREVLELGGAWDFEPVPCLDNRWGDYHWPPDGALIGAEARRFRYADEERPDVPWHEPDLDDRGWRVVTCSFGTMFWRLGPLPATREAEALEARLAALDVVDTSTPVRVGDRELRWEAVECSWRWGIEGDPGHQGYHGLKAEVHDDLFALGRLRPTMTGSAYDQEPGGTRYLLWTTVAPDRERRARLRLGGRRPASVWLRGTRRDGAPGVVDLPAGASPLLLRYDGVGRAYAVLDLEADAPAGAPGTPALFSPDARWVRHPGEEGATGDRLFRRLWSREASAAVARLRITCDNAYAAFLNGREVGRGAAWTRVQEYDVTELLGAGENVLAVIATNQGDAAGLIAELTATDERGREERLSTDASWRCARTAPPAWREPGFDDAAWVSADEVAPFEGSLWATHPMGPPALDPRGPAPRPVFRSSPLASTWHARERDGKLLRFDVRPGVDRPAGWYRFLSPPGLRELTMTVRGRVRVWVDGVEQEVVAGERPGRFRSRVAVPSPRCVQVALRVEQDRGLYGGAALPEPIRLECGPGRIDLGDWSRIDGLACYSGGARYGRTFRLTDDQRSGSVELDLGDLVSSAEVRVNGWRAGVLVAPPWRLDITEWTRSGENRVEVLVLSTLANHYLTIPTRYRGSTVAGLLGPVRVQLRPGAR